MNILPKGEELRRAVKWIADKIKDNTDKPITELIAEVSLKYNLSPLDQEFLVRFYVDGEKVDLD